jgi:regulator of sigma E protease
MSYLFAIIGLGVLIVVHELGHMLVARRCGMRVEKFSVGFGPTLISWRGRKTTYQLALIPLGGYVQIAGMTPHDKLPEDDPGSYANKSTWARLATIVAGPLTNYLFAIVIMAGVYLSFGWPNLQQVVDRVDKGSPAERGGMLAGDTIVAIAGEQVGGTADVQRGIQQSGGRTITIRVRRGSGERDLRITPAAAGGTLRIGIVFGREYTLAFTELGTWQALVLALYFPLERSAHALSGLGRAFSSREGLKQVGGPVEIVRQLSLSFEQGLIMFVFLLGLLNVYLGLFNLFPLPALDGGRLIFLIYTLVTRRPVNQRIENAVHTVGFVILLGLILLLVYRDAARILGGQ